MRIKVFPRYLLEQMWKEDEQRFAPDAENPPLCLRCGQRLDRRLVVNALSRYADVHICETCGTDEALRDAYGEPLSLWDWRAFSCGRSVEPLNEGIVLTTTCNFSYIYNGPKQEFPLSSCEHPVSELTYSRSDYNGHRWWTNWYHSGQERPAPELAKEIDQFTDALFRLPEFRTLDTMKFFCRTSAQPTNDSTEFNLYATTEHFYIWLRLITRTKDYNVYCHFYLKEAADRIRPE